MRHNSGLMFFVGLVGIAGGYLLGSANRPEVFVSELETARSVSGDKRVRLIGFLCGENGQTILGVEEDQFWEAPCKEIRVLREDVEFAR
jgi:hypothetical protein